ncbi:unnamed protein product [Owenia fusiformis]|uniref:Uncharacterized protein n=1 Tax=Owenia fusiformis TaxID=6347 RepID=A0A8J1XZ67_OWEFU|nr:unnamed protein product [Owenia fusiformis]
MPFYCRRRALKRVLIGLAVVYVFGLVYLYKESWRNGIEIVQNQKVFQIQPGDNKCNLHHIVMKCPAICTCKSTVDDIKIMDCSYRGLKEVPKGLPDVNHIDLSGNNITELSDDDFIEVSNLFFLNISRNMITHISEKSLAQLSKLRVLNLEGNTNISGHFILPESLIMLSIDVDILDMNIYVLKYLDRLEELRLETNKVVLESDFYRSILKDVPCLHIIILNGRAIRQIPVFMVESYGTNQFKQSRIRADIESGSVTDLSLETYPRIGGYTVGLMLRVIATNKAGIETLTKDGMTYYSVFKIVSLDLSGNNLRQVETGCFNKIKRFDALIFDRNDLNTCIHDLLNNLRYKKVNSLNLAHCGISVPFLNSSFFEPLKKTGVKHLDTSGNNIWRYECNAFMHLAKSLISLNMTNLPNNKSLLQLKRLRALEFDQMIIDNRQSPMSAHFPKSLKRLKVCNLQDHTSTQKPVVISNLPNLESLTICNTLDPLKYQIYNLPKLRELHMIKIGTKLVNVNISDTILDQLHVLVYRNQDRFEGIEFFNMLSKARNLVKLDISQNDFGFLKDTMLSKMVAEIQLDNLKELILAESKFTEKLIVPGLFSGGENIQVLDLSNNMLGVLVDGIFNELKSLEALHLQGNLLTYLDPRNFHGLKKLKYINIEENRFFCDCKLRDFRNWMRKYLETECNTWIQGVHQLCGLPKSMENQTVANYDLSWIDCDHNLQIALVMATLGPLLLLGAIVAILMKYRWHIEYWCLLQRYNRCRSDCCENHTTRKEHYKYSAFVVYNRQDIGWIRTELLPNIDLRENVENVQQTIRDGCPQELLDDIGLYDLNNLPELDPERMLFRLCIHQRDFEVGEPITGNIEECMRNSRRVIMVVSKAYFLSKWCSFEFQMALLKLFEERRSVIILIFLEKPDKEKVPAQMKALMNNITYLQWPWDKHDSGAEKEKELFWMRLKIALSKE